jgi:hypothetical protein
LQSGVTQLQQLLQNLMLSVQQEREQLAAEQRAVQQERQLLEDEKCRIQEVGYNVCVVCAAVSPTATVTPRAFRSCINLLQLLLTPTTQWHHLVHPPLPLLHLPAGSTFPSSSCCSW